MLLETSTLDVKGIEVMVFPIFALTVRTSTLISLSSVTRSKASTRSWEGGVLVHPMLMWKLEDISVLLIEEATLREEAESVGPFRRFALGRPKDGCGSAYSGNCPKDLATRFEILKS